MIKKYKVRTAGRDSTTLEATIPREVFERAARRHGLKVEEAIERLIAVWHYDSFDGLHLTFEEKTK